MRDKLSTKNYLTTSNPEVIDINGRDSNKNFKNNYKGAVRIEAHGFFKVPRDGTYEFFGGADDGIRIKVNDQRIVNFWRTGGYQVRSGKKYLKAGDHKVVVEYFQAGGPYKFTVEIQGPGMKR